MYEREQSEDEDIGVAVQAEVTRLLDSDEPRRSEVGQILLVFARVWAVEREQVRCVVILVEDLLD